MKYQLLCIIDRIEKWDKKLLYQDWVEDKMHGNSWELNLGPLKKKSTKHTENWQSCYILIKLLFAEQMKHSNYLDWPGEQS